MHNAAIAVVKVAHKI